MSIAERQPVQKPVIGIDCDSAGRPWFRVQCATCESGAIEGRDQDALGGMRQCAICETERPIRSAPSLREIAAQAWARHQAEVAERKRQEVEAARERFISDVHRALRAFASSTYDPFSPFSEDDIRRADIQLVESADGTPFEATVVFAGERFRYCGGQALYHVWACPICGDRQESTRSINALADLGYWLTQAPKRCYHGGDL